MNPLIPLLEGIGGIGLLFFGFEIAAHQSRRTARCLRYFTAILMCAGLAFLMRGLIHGIPVTLTSNAQLSLMAPDHVDWTVRHTYLRTSCSLSSLEVSSVLPGNREVVLWSELGEGANSVPTVGPKVFEVRTAVPMSSDVRFTERYDCGTRYPIVNEFSATY